VKHDHSVGMEETGIVRELGAATAELRAGLEMS